MKRVVSGMARIVKGRTFRNIVVVVVIFGVGVGTGYILAQQTTKDSTAKSSVSRSSTSSYENRLERTIQRLEESYNRNKDRITKDLEVKELTKDQADKITAKLDEIYKYKKENQGESTEARKILQDKRTQWREWMKQNKVSSRYFMGVL